MANTSNTPGIPITLTNISKQPGLCHMHGDRQYQSNIPRPQHRTSLRPLSITLPRSDIQSRTLPAQPRGHRTSFSIATRLVEGIQLLIPQTSSITKDVEDPSVPKLLTGLPSTSTLETQSTWKVTNKSAVHQVGFTKESQRHRDQLTLSPLPHTPKDYVNRTTTLECLRHNIGLQAPYLV